MKQVCVQNVNPGAAQRPVVPLSWRSWRVKCKRRKHHIKQGTEPAPVALFLDARTHRAFKESFWRRWTNRKHIPQIKIGFNTFGQLLVQCASKENCTDFPWSFFLSFLLFALSFRREVIRWVCFWGWFFCVGDSQTTKRRCVMN